MFSFPSRLLILLVLSSQTIVTTGKAYRWFCDISGEFVDTLALDRSTGLLYIKNPEGPVGGRSLEALHSLGHGDHPNLETSQSFLRSNKDFASAVQVVRQAGETVDTSSNNDFQEILACSCWCANNERQIYPDSFYYCIAPYTHCAIPAWWLYVDITPGCVNRTKRERFVRGVWPVILVWFGAIFICMCCTKSGRQVPDYILSTLIPNWNGWVANRIIRRDPDRADRLIREHWRRRRGALERRYLQLLAERGGAPVGPDGEGREDNVIHELVLKTRIFKEEESKANHEREDDAEVGDDKMCTICFGPIEEGDRVGELACDHVFHVECLKQWLVRRNVCPLCQMPNAAMSRPRSQPNPLDTDFNHESSQQEELGSSDQATPMDADSSHESSQQEQQAALGPQEAPPIPAWRGHLDLLSPARNRRHATAAEGGSAS